MIKYRARNVQIELQSEPDHNFLKIISICYDLKTSGLQNTQNFYNSTLSVISKTARVPHKTQGNKSYRIYDDFQSQRSEIESDTNFVQVFLQQFSNGQQYAYCFQCENGFCVEGNTLACWNYLNKDAVCICKFGFTGKQCELIDTSIMKDGSSAIAIRPQVIDATSNLASEPKIKNKKRSKTRKPKICQNSDPRFCRKWINDVGLNFKMVNLLVLISNQRKPILLLKQVTENSDQHLRFCNLVYRCITSEKNYKSARLKCQKTCFEIRKLYYLLNGGRNKHQLCQTGQENLISHNFITGSYHRLATTHSSYLLNHDDILKCNRLTTTRSRRKSRIKIRRKRARNLKTIRKRGFKL